MTREYNRDIVEESIEGNAREAVGSYDGNSIVIILDKENKWVKVFIDKNPYIERYDDIEEFENTEKASEYFEEQMQKYSLTEKPIS